MEFNEKYNWDGISTVVIDNGKTVASILVKELIPSETKVIWLSNLWVEESWRKQGIAAFLNSWVTAKYSKSLILTSISANNLTMIKIMRRFGFILLSSVDGTLIYQRPPCTG